MKRVLRILGLVLLAGLALAAAGFLRTAYFDAQRADYGWHPVIAKPTFTSWHPRVLFDEGHHNASTLAFTGRFWPFGRLLRADGYSVQRWNRSFTARGLNGAHVLVIANASGASKPQAFGINLPVRGGGSRSDPAFTAGEIDAIRSWVERGGSLLLIADHAPFGASASGLAAALGVTMHKGFVEVPGEVSDPLLFSRANGRLGDHPILNGAGAGAPVRSVMTYTGQSLDGPPGSTILLRLPPAAVESMPAADGSFTERPAGPAQGLAFELGAGRVVVLGEGGMVTAQVYRRARYGLNAPGNDNQAFVLNAMRWLAERH